MWRTVSVVQLARALDGHVEELVVARVARRAHVEVRVVVGQDHAVEHPVVEHRELAPVVGRVAAVDEHRLAGYVVGRAEHAVHVVEPAEARDGRVRVRARGEARRPRVAPDELVVLAGAHAHLPGLRELEPLQEADVARVEAALVGQLVGGANTCQRAKRRKEFAALSTGQIWALVFWELQQKEHEMLSLSTAERAV